MAARIGDVKPAPSFRVGRLERTSDGWYANVRNGNRQLGPFEDKAGAEAALETFLKRVKAWKGLCEDQIIESLECS